ncbi:hypothetical protein [Legionella sp. CNM-4043-24]|uniref:hypothetical protein n=1 Tax=Legionella sp. CNM-4043-24 TaxID=3421646 RepID=UPI00403B23D0
MMYFDKKWAAIISLNLILAVGIVIVKSYNSTISKDTDIIGTRLGSIQTQLDSLKLNLQKPVEKLDLSPINQDFNKLTALIEQIKLKDDSLINQLITENSSELNHKLDSINQVISGLDKKRNSVKYLPESVLPFQIVSIDSIQQVSVATVSYDFKTTPLEKTDTLAGWTVMQIDFGKQRLELENRNKERVLVKLGEHHE